MTATAVGERERPATLALAAAFAAVYIFWGGTFLAIRWVVAELPPLFTIAMRCAGGAIVLFARLAWRGRLEHVGRAAGVVGAGRALHDDDSARPRRHHGCSRPASPTHTRNRRTGARHRGGRRAGARRRAAFGDAARPACARREWIVLGGRLTDRYARCAAQVRAASYGHAARRRCGGPAAAGRSGGRGAGVESYAAQRTCRRLSALPHRVRHGTRRGRLRLASARHVAGGGRELRVRESDHRGGSGVRGRGRCVERAHAGRGRAGGRAGTLAQGPMAAI